MLGFFIGTRGGGLAMASACFVAVVLVACGGTPEEGTSVAREAASGEVSAGGGGGTVLATFNGREFTEANYNDIMNKLSSRARASMNSIDKKVQYLENYLISELIFERGKKQGFTDDKSIRDQIDDLERRLVIQKVMRESQSATVSDDDVRAYYLANKDQFSADRVKVSHILVEDEALANEILAKVKEDPSLFEKLAEEHSIDKSNSKRGGDLGFFGRGRMVKEFEDAAFALEEDGQLSDVVKTRFGHHIIKRTGREEGVQKSFDDVKTQIRVKLVNEKRRESTQKFLDEIKASAGLKIDREALAALTAKADSPRP
ncbi:MAG: peptidylprolyl isomerase [Candidatus Binatia bacterium]